jgi:hypothetical protein
MAYTFDGSDFYAEKVGFSAASSVLSASIHVLNGTAGETFTVALYDSTGTAGLPGNQLYSATGTFGSDGWNGVSGLSGWDVSVGNYWVAFEIGATDNLGSGSVTGALLDTGAPSPFGPAALNTGGFNYVLSPTQPLTFGVSLTDSAGAAVSLPIPEPGAALMLAAGLAVLTTLRRARSRG